MRGPLALVSSHRPVTESLYDTGESRLVGGLDTWIVRAGPQGGVPVVFLHGTPTSAYAWRDVMRAMHEERDCIAFDWPGFGQSAKPRRGNYTHRARADHLRTLLDLLQLPVVDLVAHDIGGPAALLLATEDPPRVRRLALLNTTVFKRDFRPPFPALTQFVPVVRELSRPFFNRATFEFFFKQGLARPERMPRSVLAHHWELASRGDGKRTVLDTWAQFPEGQDDIAPLREKLGSLPQETLVLFGAEDPFLPPPNAERLAKAIPRSRLALLPKAGHFVMEDAPDLVAERLLEFLGE